MTATINGTKGVTTAGLYTNGTFSDTYADGVVIDYSSPTGRIIVGTSDGIGFYNGGIASPVSLGSISSAGVWTTTGDANIHGLTVGLGAGSLSANTIVGAANFYSNSSGDNNVSIGIYTLGANTSGSSQVAVGAQALGANTSGGLNVAIGRQALGSNTTASGNTAVGYQASYSNQVGVENAVVGNQAGYLGTSSYNSYLGRSAGYGVTSGAFNVGVGYAALAGSGTSSTGGSQVAIGAYALFNVANSNYNVAIGRDALRTNATGSGNIGIGYQAGYYVTGDQNVYIGQGTAAVATSSGSYNVGVGTAALQSNTSGTYNTAIGTSALVSNTTASNNTAVGYQAGFSGAAGSANNTFVGYQAGYNTITNGSNTFIGYQSGKSVTTGYYHTIIGSFDGNSNGLDISTANRYIVLSDGAGNPRAYCANDGGWRVWNDVAGNQVLFVRNTNNSTPYGIECGYPNAAPNGTSNWFLYCFDQGGTQRASIRSNGGLANYQANNANLSDRREKTNFAPAKNYLDVICSIPVQTFNYIDQNLEEDDGLTLGVVAQDVQAVAPEFVSESNWGSEEEPKMRLSIYQTDLQYALMKCIQELKAELDELKAKVK